jgi:hypothetical protein
VEESIVQVVVDVVATNPKTAGAVALIPVVQGLGWLFSKLFKPHTIAGKWGAKIAAWPVRLPAVTK